MSRPRPELVRHHRAELALHRLADGVRPDARGLLLLHGLGESTPEVLPSHVRWPGPVWGMDFTGHGASTLPVGGGYTSQILVGDVDAVLCHLDRPVTLLGRGLGAYIALLTAAARPDAVEGAVLADGPGLAGGGVHPGSPVLLRPALAHSGTPDPYALAELSRNVRPPDYALTFVRFVADTSGLAEPLWVATRVRSEWVQAVAADPSVGTGSVAQGLACYSPA